MLSKQLLLHQLNSYPRIPLAEYPTPLEYLPVLSAEFQRAIYIKRDDGIGPGMGGNKTRKLEYLLGEARKQKAKKVVTFGGLQSNHARITAAAARKLGMEPHLIFFEKRPSRSPGNLHLNKITCANIHFIPLGSAGDGGMTLETTNRLVKLAAWFLVGSNYFIPVGGHSWLGCLGYVQAALEIHLQACEQGIENAWLVTASGTGGTLAGLLSGLRLIGSQMRPLGIDVGNLWKGFSKSVARLCEEISTRLGDHQGFDTSKIPLIESRYAAPKYGHTSRECLAAIQKLARLEGIFLDPIYTGKAFTGLLDLLKMDKLGENEPVIFLHTGGLPALFAFGDQVINDG
jgi:D-cysteine desulfhydrase family pyridoxal phosphate-dependent enzyme